MQMPVILSNEVSPLEGELHFQKRIIRFNVLYLSRMNVHPQWNVLQRTSPCKLWKKLNNIKDDKIKFRVKKETAQYTYGYVGEWMLCKWMGGAEPSVSRWPGIFSPLSQFWPCSCLPCGSPCKSLLPEWWMSLMITLALVVHHLV